MITIRNFSDRLRSPLPLYDSPNPFTVGCVMKLRTEPRAKLHIRLLFIPATVRWPVSHSTNSAPECVVKNPTMRSRHRSGAVPLLPTVFAGYSVYRKRTSPFRILQWKRILIFSKRWPLPKLRCTDCPWSTCQLVTSMTDWHRWSPREKPWQIQTAAFIFALFNFAFYTHFA